MSLWHSTLSIRHFFNSETFLTCKKFPLIPSKPKTLPPAGEDIRRLEAGVQIVSGTPGRVFDMIKRRCLQTRDIKVLVLDEADEMLAKGFREQIYDVYRCVPFRV